MLLIKKTKFKKPKSKSKKHRTFTSSEFSLLQDQRQLSIHQLFKNDAFKKRQPPAILTTAPVKKNKSQKYLQTTKKRLKSKSKLRLDKCQTYQVIPYKNSLNSQIIFSNEDTRRQGSIHDSSLQQIPIKVNQQYLIDNNRQLRINIKKQYQRKVQAAIKIQKVFRGYLTRRVLQNCLDKQQKKLQQKLAQIRSQSISQHSSYFAQKQILLQNKKKNISQQNHGIFQYSYHNDDKQSQQSQIAQKIIYRHHEPIYSQDQISGYLESSQEQDFDQDAFQNHIIFQTNQEYIDSRKSSLQQKQPRNKLSKNIYHGPIVEEPPQTPSNHNQLDQSQLTKTQKKQDRERVKYKLQQVQQGKNNTLKLHEDISKPNSSIHQFLQNSQYDATIKQKQMLKMSRKHQLTSQQLTKLKEQQSKRWSQIINLVQLQIQKPNIDNSQVSSLMKQIMDLSIKNKQLLELNSLKNSQSSSSILSEKSLSRLDSLGKIKNIKAQRQYLMNMEICVDQQHQQGKIIAYKDFKNKKVQNIDRLAQKKKENVVLTQKASFFSENNDQQKQTEQKSNIAVIPNSPLSSFDNTGQLKKFLSGNIQDQYIEQMLKLRQQLMKKRQQQDMKDLNRDLQNKKIEQTQFLNRLDKINQKYQQQKANIQRAKEDISKGHKAALKMAKQAACDAKKFGYKLPISRSVQGIKYKSPLFINDIIIDELVQRKQTRHKKYQPSFSQKQFGQSIQIDIASQQQSSQLQFTQQQLRRFRRAQPYDIDIAQQIADLGRNVMITQQLIRQQKVQDENNLMKTQNLSRQIYQIEDSTPRISNNNPEAQLISQWLFQNILWQAAGQFMIKPLFSERLVDKNHFSKPKSMTDKQRLRFIQLLQTNFPKSQVLNSKLNQKICPLPSQLLKCMRIDFTQDDDQQNSYEQIGKYQFIIGQDICNQAIKRFKQQLDKQSPSMNPSTQQIQTLGKQYALNDKIFRYLQQRQKYICNRKNHTKQLRWQVVNIEIHCIFDAWNEQLIYLRSQKAGYSGIGLNQLTLSVKDHNFQIPIEDTLSLVAQGKSRLLKNMSLSSPNIIFPMIYQQNQNQILENDSKWIFYSDQALSYGLELVYLIDEQIFTEMAKELRKKMLKFY